MRATTTLLLLYRRPGAMGTIPIGQVIFLSLITTVQNGDDPHWPGDISFFNNNKMKCVAARSNSNFQNTAKCSSTTKQRQNQTITPPSASSDQPPHRSFHLRTLILLQQTTERHGPHTSTRDSYYCTIHDETTRRNDRDARRCYYRPAGATSSGVQGGARENVQGLARVVSRS